MQAKINKLIPKDRDHWLEMRKQVVTSTEIGGLLGLSEWSTPYQLYKSKREGVEKEFVDTERSEWGKKLESTVAEAVSETLGLEIMKDDNFYWSDDMRLGASLDYMCRSKDQDEWAVLECKCVDSLIFKRKFVSEGDVLLELPLGIELQVQQQLLLTGASRAVVGVLVGGSRLFTIERFPDKEVQTRIITETRKFWSLKEPPPIVPERDYEQLNMMYNDVREGEELNADEELDELMASYNKLAEISNNADRGRKAIKAVLLDRIKNSKKVFSERFKLTRTWVPEKEISYTRGAYSTFTVSKIK